MTQRVATNHENVEAPPQAVIMVERPSLAAPKRAGTEARPTEGIFLENEEFTNFKE